MWHRDQSWTQLLFGKPDEKPFQTIRERWEAMCPF